IELSTTISLSSQAKLPYPAALLGSMPPLHEQEEDLFPLPPSPPDMLKPPQGDAFAPRNEFALEIDRVMEPPMFKVSDTHYAATWLLHEDAPHIEPPEAVKRRMQGFSNTGPKDGNSK